MYSLKHRMTRSGSSNPRLIVETSQIDHVPSAAGKAARNFVACNSSVLNVMIFVEA
jgi:hypothetical protein